VIHQRRLGELKASLPRHKDMKVKAFQLEEHLQVLI
jgi:hypothetical protein